MLNALNKVVNMTTLEVNTPLCPMLFAMTKADTVVLDPNIIKMATNACFLNPSMTPMGKKMAQNPNSFIKVQTKAGLISPFAFLKSNVAPIAINPSGVAVFEIMPIVCVQTLGNLNGNKETITPLTIPKIKGFFKALIKVPL